MDDFVETRRKLVEQPQDQARLLHPYIMPNTARHNCVHHQTMAEDLVTRGKHPLTKDAAVGVQQRKGGVIADGTDVAEMVGDSLELGHDSADDLCAQRHHDVAR